MKSKMFPLIPTQTLREFTLGELVPQIYPKWGPIRGGCRYKLKYDSSHKTYQPPNKQSNSHVNILDTNNI